MKKNSTTAATTTTAAAATTAELCFTSELITIAGIEKKAAAYGISDKDGSVYAFVEIDNTPIRLHIGKDNKHYEQAKTAADKFIAEYKAATTTKATTAATTKATTKATKTLADYIKTGINGEGWKFVFDESSSRTRLVFENTPTEKQIAAITESGFYYSKAMNSYNKKLTLKAAAAAEQLAKKL